MRSKLLLFLTITGVGVAQAGVVFDGSIGGPAGTLSGPAYQIPASRGTSAGSNLFHSFSAFDLAAGESATFTGPSTIQNILARVTGGPSTINGTVRSSISGANVYLLNPSGIVFGQGASIDVSGAFRVATADYVRLADGSVFSASGNGDVTLLAASPAAFGFFPSSADSGTLRIEGRPGSTLTTGLDSMGRPLSMVGRSVTVNNAYLRSAGGAVSLVATGTAASEVNVTGAQESPVATDGTVNLTKAAVSVSDAAGGQVSIRGGKITVDGAGLAFIASAPVPHVILGIDADARGASAGRITMDAADGITLLNGARIASQSSDARPSGDIEIMAGGKVELRSGSVIQSTISGSGHAGTVSISAVDLTIDGAGSTQAARISTQANGASSTGNAGRVEIMLSGSLAIVNGGSIQANGFGSGTAGTVAIGTGSLRIAGGQADASTGILSSNTSSGSGGRIDVRVSGHALIEDRGWIAASNYGSSQTAGRVRLEAGSLEITGLVSDNGRPNAFLTGVIGLVVPDASGRGADIEVVVPGEIRLLRGGLIDASVLSRDGATKGGTGGDVSVTAGTLHIDRMDSDFFTGIGSDTEFVSSQPELTGTTDAGNVSVAARRVELLGGGLISSSSAGSGNAGSVTVQADSIFACGRGADTGFVFSPHSGISAGTSQEAGKPVPAGRGGAVTVTAETISLCDTARIASGTMGTGSAGEVSVSANFLALASGSSISVRADQADAGTLTIRGDTIRLSDSSFTANAGGDGGDIAVLANGLLFVDRSRIEAEANGNGGNIGIPGGWHTVLDHSVVSANAINGDGGNIRIRSAVFLANESSVTASSRFGADGVVRIDPLVTLSGSEGETNPPPLDVNDVLQPECAQRLPADTGSFIVSGKGGTPRHPGGYLPSLRLLKPAHLEKAD